ncbi:MULTISPECIES: T9SS type A sorting domain-containing protein [Flavobacterium]|uniref:T9SS type A sorting domain-containing protein n=1 Tax=Flavobacterium TaxID=237 RepID=UPI002114356E|nr:MULTISPECIES: T9SS type A sorting domain-containing protein [Flavobacterium]UUF13557.1 T9SS type A sorting domain-containing protein [Flavobacterium panici]
MKKKLLLFISLFFIFGAFQNAKAQTLAPGDIAFIGFNIGGPDGFSFIALKNIPAGEIVYFTEEGLYSGGWINSSEPHIKWTVPAGVTCGKIISVIESTVTANTFTVTGGSASDFVINPVGSVYNFNLSAGDQMLAYQSADNSMRPAVTPATITFIAGIHGDYNAANYDSTTHWNSASLTGTGGGAESIIPPGLTDGVNCVALFPGTTEATQFFAKYKGTLTGSASALRASINTVNTTNWDILATDPGILPSNYTPNVTCAAPNFTLQPTSKTICPGANTTFSVAATDASSLQWQVNDGSGFTNISNGGVYSISTTIGTSSTSTLTITGVTSTMTGYIYRCVASSVNSNSATLTVPTALSSSISSQSNASTYGANNGSATISVTGGTTPYFYSWSPSGGTAATASGLSAGTYTVTITDSTPNGLGGCNKTQTVTITEPAGSIVSTTSLSAFTSCSGASTAQSFTIQGGGLTSSLDVLAPTGFEISTSVAGIYTNNISFPNVGGVVTTKTIYARLAASATGTPSGNITVSSTGITTKNVAVTGSMNTIAFTAQPSASIICAGANTTFTATASNATGYQWQVDQGAGFANVPAAAPYSGTTTATLTITGATAGLNGYIYRVVASGTCPSATSNNAALTINTAPAITAQPSASTICAGANTTFSATASGATGYQWQVDQGAGFANVPAAAPYSGTTSATLTITGATAGLSGYIYRVVATGACTPNATSNSASLTVNQAPAITAQPSASTICAGANTTFSATASNATGYQWQVDQGAGYANVPAAAPYSGTTSATLTITGATAGLNGYVYRVVATGSCTPNATSNGAALTVNQAPAITAQPSASTICAGANTTFSATAANATGYQWQVDQGAGFANVPAAAPYSGTTTATLTITGATAGLNGYIYRVVATGLCTPDATSNSASLTVNTAPSITAQPTDSAICSGSNTTFSAGVSNATGYQWQVNSGAGFSNVTSGAPYSGETTATLTITGATASLNNYQYRLIATGNCTPAAVSNAVTLQVSNIGASSTKVDISCNGAANGSLSVVPLGGVGSYTYLWSNAATSSSISNLAPGNYTVSIKDAILCEKILNFTINEPPLLVASQGTINNVSCNSGTNGTATVVVTGGTPGYTYSWSPSGGTAATASGLAAGTYTVTVTDANNCQTTQSFTISEPAALAVVPSQTDVLCNGAATGSASVAVSGGTSAYTYSWSPSGGTAATATGLTAGTYTVTVTDANSCQITQSFTITEPAALVASPVAQTNIACFGGNTGSATISATGGTGGYTYSWSPSGGTASTATGLTAGTYTVTVTDSNLCQATQSFTLTEPAAALTATAVGQTDVSCNGGANGTATVSVSGGTPGYTYSWAPTGGNTASANGLSAGTYTVTVTDANGCQTTQSFTITEPAALVASFGSQTNVSCNGGTNGTATVNVTGGTGAYTYSWSPTGGNAATASGLAQGTYTVTVTDANVCQSTQSFTITEPAILSLTSSQTDVLCNGGATGTASVVVSGGTSPYTYLWSPTGGTAATATGLAIGNYSVLVTDSNGCSITQSFTITQPSALFATQSQINATCSTGGQAAVSVSGGTTPYSYLWSPSGDTTAIATGLTAGANSVLITDANGCTITKNFTITTTNTLVATTSQTDVLCFGTNTGSASVVPSGAPGPFTYVWSPSGGNADTATNLTAGNYSVTITSANGCSIVKNFTITEPTELIVTPNPQINTSCNGGANGSASVTVTGGTGGYTYSWAPSGGTAATANGLSAGTYTVTVTDANLCTKTQSFTITEPTILAATTSQTDVSCNGGTNGTATVNVTGGTGAYTYSWAPTGGNAATASGLAAGTYTVTVQDVNFCQISASVTITEPASLATTASQTDVTCNGLNNGTATVIPTGGTLPYTYSWSPSGGTAATASGLSPGTYTATITDANGCFTTQSVTITEPTLLTLTPSHTDVSCNGGANGTATITPAGGTAPYTYSWSPSGETTALINNLIPGTYTVTVTDANGCTATESIVITEPTAMTTSASQTDISCNGATNGTATVTVSGGTGAYTYSWSPYGGTAATATGLAAGLFTATITDANGCQTIQTVTIIEPAVLSATISQTDVSCNGGTNGTATVTATGGTAPYTYSWSPSGGTAATATGLSAGTYTVTVTDANGCTTTQSVTITEPTILTASASQTDVSCNAGTNGTATVTATGGTAPYTYSWSPSGGTAATASGLSAGTYTATITDANGCITTQSVTITEPSALSVTTSKTDVSCNGGANGSATVNVTGGTPGYTYSWAPSGGTNATANGLSAGTYTATITDANGCTTTQSVTIAEPTILAATISKTDVSCNAGTNGTATVTVTGGTGAYTYSWAPFGGTAAIATGLNAGTYTVTVTDANACQTTQSIIITEPAILSATASQTDVSCNGGTNGTATVTPTGGTAPYTYSWSPSGGTAATASGLAVGTYTATITDANGCTTTQSVTITEPTILAATSSKIDVSCNAGTNGTATVTAAGGTAPYTYSWSPTGGTAATASGLSAGTYTATITDANGCSTTQTVTISEPSALSVTSSKTDVSCNGGTNGSATVNVTGGTGAYTYSWAPSGGTATTATGLSAGTYTATITDANGCTTTQSVIIAQPTILAATTSKTDVSCNGGNNGSATVTATGGTGAYTYSWSPSGGTAATATGLSAGTYTATITDANGCTTTQSVTIAQPTILAATISKTDVSCNGGTNGTATVTATGGTAPYTYAWSPSGGTSATATGLSAGTYSVTITDANGCLLTQTITIITTPDATAPVPTVASLPEISNYCAVSASDIAIPTATDNCAGILNGTTTDPLSYNAVGTYVITWKYDDGNGNITTQPQTVKVLASPLNAVTFSGAQFTYDGNAHALQVANLPTGATVTYSANNTSTNAGTYVVTATVTPSASAPNCAVVTLTANLVINKAAQQITFNAIPVKTLGANNTFNLTATSNSNLAVTYTSTYTAPLAPATVSATGVVNMLRSGDVLITAHQPGDNNYLPAADVSQLLVILNNNIDVKKITIGTKVFDNPGKTIFYVLPCGETNPNVSILNESGAIITPSSNFTIQTPKPGIYSQNVTITSQDGSLSATYSLVVVKPFNFFDIVKQKFNNVLLVNNNPQTNGGYEFASYEWFKNDEPIGTGQYYSAGNSITSLLDPTADYSVKMTTKDGKVLYVCASKVTLTNTLLAKVYPNPIEIGKVVTVEADFPEEELAKMQISLYTVTGQLVKTVQSSTAKTEIQLPQTTESNMYMVVLETPNIKKTFKVIVK